jgi:hypothetical protein
MQEHRRINGHRTSLVVLWCALALPARLAAAQDESQTPPPAPVVVAEAGPPPAPEAGTALDEEALRLNRKKIRIGAIGFGVAWGLAIGGSILTAVVKDDCVDCGAVSQVLWIPFAGPILADVVDASRDDFFTTAMICWSVVQVGAAAVLIWGLVERARLHDSDDGDEAAWRLQPLVGQVGGLALSRRF